MEIISKVLRRGSSGGTIRWKVAREVQPANQLRGFVTVTSGYIYMDGSTHSKDSNVTNRVVSPFYIQRHPPSTVYLCLCLSETITTILITETLPARMEMVTWP